MTCSSARRHRDGGHLSGVYVGCAGPGSVQRGSMRPSGRGIQFGRQCGERRQVEVHRDRTEHGEQQQQARQQPAGGTAGRLRGGHALQCVRARVVGCVARRIRSTCGISGSTTPGSRLRIVACAAHRPTGSRRGGWTSRGAPDGCAGRCRRAVGGCGHDPILPGHGRRTPPAAARLSECAGCRGGLRRGTSADAVTRLSPGQRPARCARGARPRGCGRRSRRRCPARRPRGARAWRAARRGVPAA